MSSDTGTIMGLGEDFAERVKHFPLSDQIAICASMATAIIDSFPTDKQRMIALIFAETVLANAEGRESRV